MVTKACMEIPIYAFNLALCHIWIKLMKHKLPLHKISNIPKDSIRLINFRDNETFTKMGRFQNFLEFFLVIHEGIIWSKKIWKTEFSLSPPVSPPPKANFGLHPRTPWNKPFNNYDTCVVKNKDRYLSWTKTARLALSSTNFSSMAPVTNSILSSMAIAVIQVSTSWELRKSPSKMLGIWCSKKTNAGNWSRPYSRASSGSSILTNYSRRTKQRLWDHILSQG